MKVRHRLAAIWFADIVDYSRLSSIDQAGAVRLVAEFQLAARQAVERFGGRIVKFLGDGALAEFQSVTAAIAAADELRQSFALRLAEHGPSDRMLRIGIHSGEVVEAEDGDVYGDGVNVAARVCEEAAPGEIVATHDVYRQARLQPEIETESLGSVDLKGVGTLELFRIQLKEPIEPDETEAAHAPGGIARAWRTRPRPVVFGVIAVFLIVAGWFGFRLASDAPEMIDAAALDPARLAVLYFEDRTPGGNLEYLARGFTESIIHSLSGTEPLDVVSRHGVERFAGTDVPLDSIARALGAGTLVDGSVARIGDTLRVSVQLVDGRDLSEIASWQEERPWSEILELQDEISADVTDALRRRLGERLRTEARRRETSVVEAWDLVLRAERLDAQAKTAASTVAASLRQQADSLLARAEQLDPAWIEPRLARAEIAAKGTDAEAYARGLAHVGRALTSHPGNPRALYLRGVLHDSLASAATDSVQMAGELAKAQGDLRAALAGDPGLAPAWIALADLLYNDLWDLPDAREAARRAYQEDAFLLEDDHFVWLCEISLQLEDYEEAERWCTEGRRRFPGRARLVMTQLVTLASPEVEPDPAAAWGLVRELVQLDYPEYNVPPAEMEVAAVLARAGLPDSARAVILQARAGASPDVAPFLDYIEAYVRLVLGERARAKALLEAFLRASPPHRAVVAVDPWFEPLRGDADFETLVDRVHAPIFCRLLCGPPE